MPRNRSTKTARSALICLFTLVGLTCLATTAGANPAYNKACEQTEKLTADLQSYQLRGTITMINNVKGETSGASIEAEITAAARWPDRLMSSQQGKMISLNLGTGPEQSWFYFGQMRAAYISAPTALGRELADAGKMELAADKIYNFYNGITQFLLATDLKVALETGHEKLTVNGAEVECLVFTTLAPEDAEGAEPAEEGPQTIYFDPNSGLVLKTEQTIQYRRQGTQFAQHISFALAEFTLNEAVDEALFTFTPPARVRVVNELDRLTNPDAMTGEQAPDITFTDFEGKTFQLSELRGKPVFIDFWATWCGPCKMEMPHIETLYQELASSGQITIIAASSEDRHTVQRFLARNPYTFQVVTVAGEEAQQRFKTNSIPAGFVIDAEGVIRAHMIGAQTEAQLRAAFAKVGVQ